jgi:hypothetical protein
MKQKYLMFIILILIIRSVTSCSFKMGFEIGTKLSAKANSEYLNRITQNGITVTFDNTYAAGQYVSGDYWIVDPGTGVTITSTSHIPVSGVNSGESLTKNPVWQAHAYDTRDPCYKASYKLPLPGVLHAGDSVVVATSNTSMPDQSYLYSAIIITVVDVVQSSTKFRPPYCRSTRVPTSASDPLIFDYNSITSAKWAELPGKSMAGIAGLPTIASTQALARGPWLDNDGTWWAAYCHPSNQEAGYGRDYCMNVSLICAQLCMAYNLADLQLLATYLIQAGIDNYSCVMAGGCWPGNGGHGSGRKISVMFAAEMLGSSLIASVPQKMTTSGVGYFVFGEDGQTYLYNDSTILPAYLSLPSGGDTTTTVSELASATAASGYLPCLGVKGQMGILNGGSGDTVLWRCADTCPGALPYELHEHIPIAQWDIDESDNAETKWESYRVSCTSHVWIGEALLVLLWKNTNLLTMWNHNLF